MIRLFHFPAKSPTALGLEFGGIATGAARAVDACRAVHPFVEPVISLAVLVAMTGRFPRSEVSRH